MAGKNYLKKIFDALTKALPAHASGSSPLGAGAFGIVVEHQNLTVSKFIFRAPNPEAMEFSLKAFYREAQILENFRREPLKDIDVPVLLGEPEELYTADFAATYKMTKVNGENFMSLYKRGQKRINNHALYEEAGAIAARLHRISIEHFPKIADRDGYDGLQVRTVSGLLADKTNRALEKTNEYLQAHRWSGLVHGDMGEHNFVYKNGIPSGLVDFAFTGVSENQASDFTKIPDDYLPSFAKGYEQEGGRKIDTHLVTASKISQAANLLFNMKKHGSAPPEHILIAIENLNTHLNNMTYITGFKP